MKQEEEFLNNLIAEKDTIVLACSGGPDSMCLLYLLNKIKNQKKIKLIVAHINHKKRKESKEEYQFVKKYCEERDILFEGTEFENYSAGNFHNEAHQKRKQFYETIIQKYHAKYLMTAHHGDDLMETILMRLTRGSSRKGYAGFSKIENRKEYTVVRPLITATKNEIAEFDKMKDIPYVTDQSNTSEVYTRNRYRKVVLPFLKKENPQVHQKFLQFSENMCRINEFIVKIILDALTKCLQNDTLLIANFQKLELFLKEEVIKEYLSLCLKDNIAFLEEKHWKCILAFLENKKEVGSLSLPRGYLAYKNNGIFWIEKEAKEETYCTKLNEVFSSKKHKIEKIADSNKKNNNILRLNSEEIALPLYVRTRNSNDKMEVKHANGHQKVNRIFIDKKVPKSQRETWPIVVDAKDNILWIPGIKKSKFDKELSEKYDIIYKYDFSEEKNYVTKK